MKTIQLVIRCETLKHYQSPRFHPIASSQKPLLINKHDHHRYEFSSLRFHKDFMVNLWSSTKNGLFHCWLAGWLVLFHKHQWEFQDPKMEVLYHIRPYFAGDIPLHRPYIGLIYGRYLQFRILKFPLKTWQKRKGFKYQSLMLTTISHLAVP